MQVENFYGPRFDLSFYSNQPKQIYMVASIPRSGSTYFLRRLWERGVFGAPLEYLNPNMNSKIVNRLGRENYSIYWTRLKQLRTTPNGVFGFKMFIGNYVTMIDERPEFLDTFSPDNVIYFTRSDKVAQAVSYARAIMTKKWFAYAKEDKPAEYDFDAIYDMENSINIQEAKWERIFKLGEANPLRVQYEYFLDHEDHVMREIASHLSVDLDPAAAVRITPLEKQGDEISLEWADRYKAEKIKKDVREPAENPEIAAIMSGVS